MGKTFNENSRVKIPAILHLTRLQYKYISLQQVEQQIDSETNIYKEIFRVALNQINRIELTDKDVGSIISDLKNLLDAEDLGMSFYEKFFTGIAFAGESIRLIDFENLENNIFEVMTEVPYRNGADSFRPDITIFVNGLPLAFVEVKIPDNKQGIQAEHRRMSERFSQEKYKRFANAANTTTTKLFRWKERFMRRAIMFVLRYGFAYVKDSHEGGITTIQKHVMRYQQMFAEFKIKKMLDGGGKRGVIWHTQGSGKTALAYHSVKFLTDYYQWKNYSTQFYFIVDRLELLQQAASEFRKRGLEVNEVNSRENFVAAIQRAGSTSTTGKLSITVINIQKFSDESVATEPKFNVNVQRIYFIDEAHRGYKWDGSFLARLMKSDREAVMIALTGTPLIGEYKTRDIFGSYIHSYYYNQSIADGYTLRLIREGIKTEYRLKLQAALSHLEKQVAKGTLDKDKIYSHENYVSPLVEYIENDFEQSRERLGDETIGAMIACDSSEQAKAICDKLTEHGKFSAELVLSTVGYSDKELNDKRTNFKQGNVDILVVFKMLLTGFDAPRLKKLYLGRKIKEHNLLQALTRVNRPYGKMRYGYVVDFADIQAEFDKTNQAYLHELQEELGNNFGTYKKIFKSQEEIAEDLFFVKDKLFQFDIDNAEEFRKQIQAVEDKKIILELRRAIELYKECYNLAEQYDYSNLQFDIKKIFDLSKVINQRVQMLNLKEAMNNTDDMTTLISLAVDDVEFSFKKISEQELGIEVEFLKVRRKTCREFEINADKKDPEYIALLEELRRILEQYNIEEMTTLQMQDQQHDFDALRKKIHDLNAENDRLTIKYIGDKKFMRIHKRLSNQDEFSSPTMLHELLIEVKTTVDDKLLSNYAVLDNAPYFESELKGDLIRGMEKFSIPAKAKFIKNVAAIIAQEYIDERNALS